MTNFLFIVVAVGLVLLNGFFVAAEFAMVKLRRTRVQAIKDVYGLRGRILSKIHDQLDAYLSACQLGITLASLGLGWVGEPAFAGLAKSLLNYVGIFSEATIKAASYGAAFAVISFLHIVAGELMPKSMAIRRAERISLWTAIPLYIFYWAMYPAIWVLNASSNFLLRNAGVSEHHGESVYSDEELKMILNATHAHGELTREEAEIMEQTIEFADLRASDVMRPVEELVALDVSKSLAENLEIIAEHRYSRYPVYADSPENIIGIIHIKDLLIAMQQHALQDLKMVMRPVFKVMRDLSTLDLFRRFRRGEAHFALVYSDRETLIGFITLDNLLYALVGRIKDEFHKTRDRWRKTKRGNLLIKGNSSIYTLERALDIQLPDEVDTIGGLILTRLERLPVSGERIPFKEFDVVVKKMDGPRIELVKIYPKK